jgi:hypothetical protein
MDTAVGLVEAYLRVNGYFTVTEYPVVETCRSESYRTATDLDVLAFRFPGAGRLLSFQAGGAPSDAGAISFAPDPCLGGQSDQADMLIGEVKEGRAELNATARDPLVLRAALSRFGCCTPDHVPEVVEALLQHGRARAHCGHVVRMVAFGSLPPLTNKGQFKDPAFGFELLLEKARRGSHASLA